MNIVGFRETNASVGVEAADAILKAFGRRLKSRLGAEMFVARVGADSFAVARSGLISVADAAEFAEQVLADCAKPLEIAGRELSVAARIGIADSNSSLPSGQRLLSQADFALERARSSGGANYQFFAASMEETAKARQELIDDLQAGLRNGDLFIVCQPKVSIHPASDGQLSGAEVLLRWRHAVRGWVRPDEFIPVAESAGLITQLGDFVLYSACWQIRAWLNTYGWSPRLAVNLSARQFSAPGLKERIEQVLRETEVSPSQLEVEVTETAAMHDVEKTAATLQALRALGVKVSIDDFGTGYSSLNYLRLFQVDAIKIDKSFVDDIETDANAKALCSAMLRIGQALGFRVVAEGVETTAQLEFLRRGKCDEVQGYLIAKPMPCAEFEKEWVAGRRGVSGSALDDTLASRALRGDAATTGQV